MFDKNKKLEIQTSPFFTIDDFILSNSNILEVLLIDRTTNSNITWCNNSLINGDASYFFRQISKQDYPHIVSASLQRRVKSNQEKKVRIKKNAEVFSPAWLCNHQNNLADNLWFGKENLFNIEEDKGWITNSNYIPFEKRSWEDYVLSLRIEITCGEAPYIASRYDCVSGDFIPLKDRIGLLDRKIRVINENIDNERDWYNWVIKAYQSVYGFEWQGDSLLIARVNLLLSFVEYYTDRFNFSPSKEKIEQIATIISWNFWQMDGLKGVIPKSCSTITTTNLFGDDINLVCRGCEDDDIYKHIGIYSKIMDWERGEVIRFIDLIKQET